MPEVISQLLDRDTLGQQDRGIEVPEGMHAVGTLPVVKSGCGKGWLPDDLAEQITVADTPMIIGGQQSGLMRVAVGVLPRQRDRCRRIDLGVGGDAFEHATGQRDDTRLATLGRREDELAADDADLTADGDGYRS